MSTAVAPHALPTTSPTETRVTWLDFALCKGKTDIFFGPPGERPSKRRKRETLARSYCEVCAVAEPCRNAGRIGLENGVWGGENEEGRARAGHTPKATERRSVAAAAREARVDQTITAMRQSA